ncbi:MAG: hypothetical protein GY801_52225, partial [bacterium]|nr:hypothetical protein [bacterium]
ETQHIDFRKAGKPDSFLLRGWSYPRDEFTFTSAKESSVAFYRYNVQQPLPIEISCRLFSSVPESTLPVEVVLNEQSIGTFTARTEISQPFTLTAPIAALRSGLNILEFRFPQHSTDRQETSLAFHNIRFPAPQTLFHQSQEVTQEIHFGADANPGMYLQEGWSYPESRHTWAAAGMSSLVFFSYGAIVDVTLE